MTITRRRKLRHRLRWVATVLAGVVLLGASAGLAACGSQMADQTSEQPDTTSSLVTTTEASTTTSTPAVSSTSSSSAATPSTSEGAAAAESRNTDYGFTFSLPESWKGYSIVTEQWERFPLDTGSGADSSGAAVDGLWILIRHRAEWTSSTPRQDIPVMVFTLAQWALVQQEKLSVGAAPIPPTELGRNATYAFALPARYNYAFPTGYEEVERILEGRPLQGF